MKQTRLFALLIKPSTLSAATCISLAVVLLAALSWSYAGQVQFFYDLLFGPTSIATALIASPDIFNVLRRNVLASPATYYIVLMLSAAPVALLVYELLQGIGRIARQASAGQTGLALREAFSTLVVRAVSLAAWTVYLIVFVGVLMPFVESAAGGSLKLIAAGDWTGWLFLFGGGVLLTLGLHMHVIFARLTTQRLRLFSTLQMEP